MGKFQIVTAVTEWGALVEKNLSLQKIGRIGKSRAKQSLRMGSRMQEEEIGTK